MIRFFCLFHTFFFCLHPSPKKHLKHLPSRFHALKVLHKKRDFCVGFFQCAKNLGNQLNRGSHIGTVEEGGFELSALEKLAQTKSSAEPRATLYHFVLSILNVKHEKHLFSESDIKKLEAAKTLRA